MGEIIKPNDALQTVENTEIGTQLLSEIHYVTDNIVVKVLDNEDFAILPDVIRARVMRVLTMLTAVSQMARDEAGVTKKENKTLRGDIDLLLENPVKLEQPIAKTPDDTDILLDSMNLVQLIRKNLNEILMANIPVVGAVQGEINLIMRRVTELNAVAEYTENDVLDLFKK